MQNTRKITEQIDWIGGMDRRLAKFENLFPLSNGVSYNSYLISDQKTAVIDTVDHAVSRQFAENVEYVLQGRALDYLVVNHMEPDHCAAIGDLYRRYPDMQIVGNQTTLRFIRQFYDLPIGIRTVTVEENTTLSLGEHVLRFVMAPMVHWPEAMVTFEEKSGILFSADAFGSFGALDGALFEDEVLFTCDWLEEVRRYYTNIVGKYGVQVQSLLKKAANLPIRMICPLHGLIWRSHLSYILEKYDLWSKYEPEEQGVLIVYGSMYGNTENAANILAAKLADNGARNITVRDAAVTDISYLIGKAFQYSTIVLASPTYNNEIYAPIEHFIADMKALNLQNRTFALIENGTWAPSCGKKMMALLQTMKNTEIMEESITIKSSLKPENEAAIQALADKLSLKMQSSSDGVAQSYP